MPGKIRIIGGRWRGRKLTVPDRPELRPSGDRVRETLFNWLAPRIVGARCIDLFAGSGALGLEAASRGADRVVMIERDGGLAGRLAELVDDWPGAEALEVVHADALQWLNGNNEEFDLVLVDPPFDARLQQRVLEMLVAGRHLADRGRVYVELGINDTLDEIPGLAVVRDKRVGRVRMLLLEAGDGPVY